MYKIECIKDIPTLAHYRGEGSADACGITTGTIS